MSVTTDRTKTRSRSVRGVGLALLAVGALLVVVWAVGLVRAGVGLVREVRKVEALMDTGVGSVDLASIGPLLENARRHTVVLKQRIGWLAPLGPHLKWIPRVGPMLGAAPELLELGDSLTALGALVWRDMAPVLEAYQQGTSVPDLLPQAVPAMAQNATTKVMLAERAATAYAQLDVTALPYRFRGPVDRLGRYLPLLPAALGILDRAPVLLGLDEPATYLVVVLNEDELRPGGGFLTAAAEVVVADADIVSMAFQDSYAVDDFSQPYPDPPDVLRQWMELDLWVFRDSNWSPDFPTAARQAIELYRPGYPVSVNGVVGIDLQAVTRLVDALGPLSVAGQTEAVTGETLLFYIYTSWQPEDGVIDHDWWLQRKDFMGEVANAAIEKVKSGNVDYLQLAEAVLAVLDERHVQVYVEDEQTARLLAETGWDGGMPVPESQGDVLGVVEANIGYNKASSRIARHLVYDVDLTVASPTGVLALHYENLNQPSEPCNWAIRYETDYQAMIDRCYWANLRVFAPQGSVLREASQHPIPADLLRTGRAWSGEAWTENEGDYTVFSQVFLLPRGEMAVVRFTYELPDTVVQATDSGISVYRLLLRKQAGWKSLDAEVSLRLPENAVVLSARPQPAKTGGDVLHYDFNSSTDVEIVLEYRLQEE